jgi:hypothetical protein
LSSTGRIWPRNATAIEVGDRRHSGSTLMTGVSLKEPTNMLHTLQRAGRQRGHSAGRRLRIFVPLLALAALPGLAVPAFANNLGENYAWQFRTSADIANQAALLDLMEKRRGGYYAAQIYTTNIARQVNCTIAANATGNSGAQSAVANSPTVAGAVSTATGNANTATTGDGHGEGQITGTQTNGGAVTSGITGSTECPGRRLAGTQFHPVK